jgi:hypothetical protein
MTQIMICEKFACLLFDPNIERIVDMGFSPPKNSQNLSLEYEKNLYIKVHHH